MPNNKPQISVVIASYNISDYIVQCLESILCQSFTDIEAICIDDCSTDDTHDILMQYEAKDDRVRVIHFDQNQGLSIARNAGIEAAKGNYLLFLDGDDYHKDGSLQLLYDVIRANDLDLLLFDREIFYSSGTPDSVNLHPNPRIKSINRIMTGAALLALQASEKEYSPSVGLQMVKTEFLKESGIRFFPGIIHEDELYTPLIMEKAQRAMCIDNKLYMRRVRSDSIMTTTISHKNVDGYFVVSTELMARYIANGCQNEGVAMRAKSMRGASLDRYRLLSDEEKAKSGKQLPEIYRFLFERNNFKFEDEKKQNIILKQKIEELESANSQSQQEIKVLTKQYEEYVSANAKYLKKIDTLNNLCAEYLSAQKKLIAEKNKLSNAYSDLLNSYSYKIGRMITYLPRKIRDFFADT